MDIEDVVETLRVWMTVRSLEDAVVKVRRLGVDAAVVDAARRRVQEEVDRIRLLPEPPAIADPDLPSWYPGPLESGSLCWPPYRDLLVRKRWRPEDLDALDRASTRIVSLLHHPATATFQTRGLVLGYVQSGKTANYTGVIAKAADAGYRMFIVLAGLTNKLRRQTQLRLQAELCDLNRERWIALTDEQQDFHAGHNNNANAFLARHNQQKVLCVVKKNGSRLRRLLKWLRSAQDLVIRECPVLVIDDEADQASLNTADFDAERSRINQAILEILAALPKAAFVGYTATPFANIFVDPSPPEDLYPRHFIVDLPRPASYFGPERIFGRDRLTAEEDDEATDGLDVIRTIADAEVRATTPAKGEAVAIPVGMESTPALADALRYFWMATAARHARGQANSHSTMLVHTSQLTRVHSLFRGPIESLRMALARAVAAGDAGELAALRGQWDRELSAVERGPRDPAPVAFATMLEYLPQVLGQSKVVVENYLAAHEDRLVYGDEPGTFVVVGGNILSRGLTLEGLVVSYFVRSANAFDTLLQMGRWFGYRRGYEDLPRIWMADQLKQFFFDLATVEREIRLDIQRYEVERVSPLEFAPRIRMHPQLLITSRLKMRHAVECDVSYGNQRAQTILFRRQDQAWLDANMKAGRALVHSALASGCAPAKIAGGRVLLAGVPVSHVLTFLNSYAFHEDSWNLVPGLLRDYIEEEVRQGSLQTWNVGVIGLDRSVLGTIDFGLPWRINLVRRSRLKIDDGARANIKGLLSRADMAVDLPDEMARGAESRSWAELTAMRNAQRPRVGLLLLYPIDRRSPAPESSKTRLPLEAAGDVLGVGLAFPAAMSPQRGRRYMTADLSRVPQEPPEISEEDRADLQI